MGSMIARSGFGSRTYARLLSVGSFVVRGALTHRRASGATSETRGIEDRHVHRRAAVEQPLGDEAARRRRMLEAVAAEADREEKALDARRPADDRVVVGGQRPKARPAAGDARALEDRQPMHRLLDRL